jgi:L-ribulose-5-phosphate 4-epimerase
MPMQDEGVILFNCHWQKGLLPTGVDVTSLLHIRNLLFELGLIGFDKQEQVGYGNISIRVNVATFIISGTQTGHIPILDSTQLSYVTDADITHNTLHCTGPAKASSESLTHAAIYNQFADAQAVIHVHHHQLWTHLMNKVPTTLANIGYGTTAMAGEIARLAAQYHLEREKILVMRGHQDGIICFGENLTTAYDLLLQHYQPLRTKK